MPSHTSNHRWVPFVTFLAGVALTASTVVVLDHARGQIREGAEVERPSAPLDPRLPQEVADPNPGDPRSGREAVAGDWEVDADEGGVEALYNAVFRRGEPTPPEEVGEPPSREELARERYELAGRALQSAIQRFAEPPRGGASSFNERIGPILEWSRRRIDARLDLAGSKEERIAALRKEIAHTRAILATLNELSRGGASSVSQALVQEFDQYRLELEVRLAELEDE